MKGFFRGIRKIETVFTVFFMLMFTVTGFLQVVFRVFLKSPLGWSEEACRYSFIWSMILGAVLVSAENGHFRVDFLVNMLPTPIRKILTVFSYLLIGGFSVILIRYGYLLMMSNTTRISPALGIKMTYIYTIFIINGCLVLLHLAESVYHDFFETDREVEV